MADDDPADPADPTARLARLETEITEAKRRLSTLRREGERHFIDDRPVDPTVTDALQRLVEEHERLHRLYHERGGGSGSGAAAGGTDLDALEARIRQLRAIELDPHRSERHFIDD